MSDGLCITANLDCNVRFGLLADIEASPPDVRFTPKSRHHLAPSSCPLCAKNRHSGGCWKRAANLLVRI
jgi:hypothetical protein